MGGDRPLWVGSPGPAGANCGSSSEIGVQGTAGNGQTPTFRFDTGSAMVPPERGGTHASGWRVSANGGWVGPEIAIRFTLGQDAGRPGPNPPQPDGPDDWAVLARAPPLLEVRGSSGPGEQPIAAFRFAVLAGNQSWGSGWVNENSIPAPDLGRCGYEWQVKVRDPAGTESDWTTPRHFRLQSYALSTADLSLEPASPSAAQAS